MGIYSALKSSFALHGSSPLFVNSEKKYLNYVEGLEVIEKHGRWLLDTILYVVSEKCEEKEVYLVIAYLSTNSPDLILSFVSCTKILELKNFCFMLPAMLNFRWTENEIASSLSWKTNASVGIRYITIILYGPGFEKLACKASQRVMTWEGKIHYCCALPLPCFTNMTNPLNIRSHVKKLPIYVMRNNTDAVILFTSGTSGCAKGVRLSHVSLHSQAMAKLNPPCSYSSHTNMIATTVPFFHVGGMSSTLAVMLAGGSLVFWVKSIFHPANIIQCLSKDMSTNQSKFYANTLVLVPAMCTMLHDRISSENFPHVTLILIGGQSMSQLQLSRTIKFFPNARLVQTYACTEAGSSITFAEILGFTTETFLGDYVGTPPPHIRVGIFHPDDKHSLPCYKVGIIGTSGPHVMNGYWKGTSFNKQFFTNDLGYLDHNNRLFFCARVNDVVRTGGETVYASEVERVVSKNTNVQFCAVVALPDQTLGETVTLVLVLHNSKFHHIIRADESLVQQIRHHCRTHQLAGYKHPRLIFIINELPRNSAGKILKHKLKNLLLSHMHKSISKL